MEMLSEDPTYLAGGLGLLGVALLIALKVTQQGKYLLWAIVALGLALMVVVVERLWVTDNERVEAAVHGLARAVASSDVDGTLAHFDEDIRYVRRGITLPPLATRALARELVSSAKFDFLRLTHLRAHAGGQSRRGTAEFQVISGGSIQRGGYTYNFGSTNSTWSLGLREVRPGVWKVNRITPVSVPAGENVLPR